jgi:hypothetical protein
MTSLGGPVPFPREDIDGRIAFQPWEVDLAHAPDCWDAKRIAALPTGERRDKVWLARRKHAPCCTKIPPAWGLYCIYLSLPEEETYARILSSLLRQATLGHTGDVALNLVSFNRPLFHRSAHSSPDQLGIRFVNSPRRGTCVRQGTTWPETVAMLFSARAAWPGWVNTARFFASTGSRKVNAAGMLLSPGHRSNSSNCRPRHAGPCIRPCPTGGPNRR